MPGLFNWPILRSLPENGKEGQTLYLTFDDAPTSAHTPRLINLLNETQTKASFFCIAEQAKRHKPVMKELIQAGHTIGNHSLDHRYKSFFLGVKALKNWISTAEAIFREEFSIAPAGFRSPAGVLTPELFIALKSLQYPLIHWNRRFFDKVFPLSKNRLLRSLGKLKNGSIILLHENIETQVLKAFISEGKSIGFNFKSLPPRKALLKHYGVDYEN